MEASATGRGGSSIGGATLKRLGIAAIVVFSIILLGPVLIAPLPPMDDYPNHLARMWLLSSPQAQTIMAPFYRVQFDTFTNIGIDLIAMTLGRVAGYVFAGRFSIALCVLLPPLGGALLWWSVHRRLHWWMLSFGLLAWGSIVINGFLNFQIAIGLALIFAALEPWVVRRSWVAQLVIRAVLSVMLLLAHPFGLLFYAMLLGALAIGPNLALRDWPAMARRIAPAFFAILLVSILFLLFVPSLPGTQENSGIRTIPADVIAGYKRAAQVPARKLFNALFAFRAYDNKVDGATTLAFLLPVALSLLFRRLGVHAGLLMLSGGLLLAYLLCPDTLFGAGWVDGRFAVMMAFAFAVAVSPNLAMPWSGLAAALLAIFFVGRATYIGTIWHARQADVASLTQALAPVPAGSSVIAFEMRIPDRKQAPIGRYSSGGENSFRHMPPLAIPWQHAFVPSLFAARGKQPVVTNPPWLALSEPNGGILSDIHVLDDNPPPGADSLTVFYLDRWRQFDYILLVNADIQDEYGPFTPPAGVSLLRDAGFARLYKIAH